MKAGKLRHLLSVQSQASTRDSFGGAAGAWVTEHIVHGAIEPLEGREYFAAQQFNSEVTHKIRLRYLSGITTTMRILYGSRTFDINQVMNPEEKNRELELYATERL